MQLRDGMARQRHHGRRGRAIITSITSFALYGFPESHAASFALIAYASAYLKAHYPAAFYAALLNNQPMGFYHPATLVKDAQRRGVHFAPIDVQVSDWDCTVDAAGRSGSACVRHRPARAVGRAIAAVQPPPVESSISKPERCPKCGCDDATMIETAVRQGTAPGSGLQAPGLGTAPGQPGDETGPGARSPEPGAVCFCNVCAHDWQLPLPAARRFRTIEDLIRRTGVRRDELAVLAEIGALNSLGHDRRGALWQIERAVRPEGELFEDTEGERPRLQVQAPAARRGHGARR